MKHEVNVPCTVCGGSESQLLHAIDYQRFSYPGLFQIRQCQSCGLIFNSPRLTDDGIVRLYDGNYYVFLEPPTDALSRVATLMHQTVATVSAQVPDKRMLEVGSAKGYLLAIMAELGWTVAGVELSEDAAEHARHQLGQQVYTGTLQAHVTSDQFSPYPLVVSTDVIEHVTDLEGFVRACHRAVAPGGLLLLGTPNADSIHRHRQGERWLGFNPFHIFLFNRHNLGTLLARHGFEVVQAYTCNNTDDPPPLMPQDSPLKKFARRGLQATGLMAIVRDVMAHKPSPSATGHHGKNLSLPDAVRHTAQELRQRPPYFSTTDGSHPRSAACLGDNLVVVARRQAEPGTGS